jgi:uncharacterized protein
MMKKLTLLLFVSLVSAISYSQTKKYGDSLKLHISNYINTHGVVRGEDRKYLQFFPVAEKFRIAGWFERTENSP